MKKMILGVLALGSMIAQAEMKVYDGFAAGGDTPGTGEYLSDPASTTGSNNDSILGQDPVVTGFDAGDVWVGSGAFSADVYPRVDDTGLDYTDGNGAKLLTVPGGLDFSSGTTSGDFEARRPTNVSGALPDAGVFFSALIQFGEGSKGMVRWTQGYGQPFQRDHYVGFTTNGTLFVGVYNTATGTGHVEHEYTNVVYSADTPHLVVVKWYEENSAGLWVDPSDLTDLATEPRLVTYTDLGYVGDNSSYSLDYLKVKVAAEEGSSFLVDEIRFATTWPEVLPVYVAGEPLIDTMPVSGVSHYSATINGYLSSTGGAPTTVWAAWGEAGSLGVSTPLDGWPNSVIISPDPMVSEEVDLSHALTGLDGDTTYVYRFFASNSWGIAAAPAIVEFTTLDDKPVITVDPPTEVTKNSFTLNSSLVSTGTAPTTVWAVWDEVDHPAAVLPSEWPNSFDLGVSVSGAVSHAVSELINEARYNYRFYATNANGAAWSDVQLVLLDSPPAVYDGFSASETPDLQQYQAGGTYPDDHILGQSPLCNGFDTNSAWVSTYQYASTVYWQVRTNELVYSRLKTTPGSLRFFRESAGQGKRIARHAAVSVVSETWWAAFLLQYSDINGTAFYVELNGGTPNTACRIGIDESGHLNFEGGGSSATSQAMESVLSTNETHLVLMRFTEQPASYYADVDIWLDPVLTSSAAGLGAPDIADQSSVFSEYYDGDEPDSNIDVQHGFSWVALESSTVNGPIDFIFDELTVAKSYDALPIENAAGTILLLN